MDSKKIAVDGLKSACKVFLQDLQALPEEAFSETFGGKTRNASDIVYEINLVNDMMTTEIQGGTPPPWPEGGWLKAPEDFLTKDVVVAAFEKSSQNAISVADSYSSEDFESVLKTGDGETNRFERCRFMTLHLWYHSGQLNYIQTLIGDDEWHWK